MAAFDAVRRDAPESLRMSEAAAFYVPEGDGFVGTVLAQGAWDPGSQTGVAVLALIGHVLEDIPTLAPMSLSRITTDLVRPVPIGPKLEVVHTIIREGKKIQVIDVSIVVGDVEHVRARVLRLRDDDISAVPGMPESSTSTDPATRMPPPDQLPEMPKDRGPGMMGALDLRRGPIGESGAFGYWLRLRVPVVDGQAVRPTSMQTVAVDFANSIGAVIEPSVASTINPDVTGQFLRAPTGAWLGVVGDTRIDQRVGRGVSNATLSDREGVFAVATASQLVQPMQRSR